MKNILNSVFETQHQSAPFEQIQTTYFIPALELEISKTLEEIDHICSNPAIPTFENTLEALEQSGEQLGIISGILFNLNSAETSNELQEVTQKAAPLLTKFQNDVRLNKVLFDRIKNIFDKKETLALDPEQLTLIEKEYKGFVRNGALLSAEDKDKLRLIDTELAQLSLSFGEHVLADTQAFELHLTDKKQLSGLPQTSITQAEALAKEKNKDGWVFTLDYPSYVPFVTFADDRALRKKMSLAFGKRGFQKNENNNESIILKLVQLKKDRANLLGYSSHADFVLEERMAQSASQVNQFLDDLYQNALPYAKKEWEQIERFAEDKLDLKDLQKWDTSYVSEKLKQELFDFDEQILKPYFPLPNVLKGLFEIVERLYGLRFEQSDAIQGYHKDVICYEVFNETGGFHALLYADFHPRSGKRSGAWMTSYRSQNQSQRPHISIVCNFSPPTNDDPALLSFNEVTTLFHEFGHALHGMLANTKYGSLSGTSVSWDFVELPSQILENWCYQEEALSLFAHHYQTGEPIPMHYVQKIKDASQFQQGLQTLRQLSFGYLDLSYHNENATEITSVKVHEEKQISKLQFTPSIEENCMSTSFSHIFQGGYAAGYYSYKWAEVLDADAFELFLEKGVFDKKTAQAFHDHVLSKGGTEHPMKLYKRFRGSEPDPKALLRRAGLIEK
ncbi:M3 family metallopeptidase [Flavobacteriaceae bacterium]|nr:M3 family metallopeptidase [Flavobacteriaceae bacterium]